LDNFEVAGAGHVWKMSSSKSFLLLLFVCCFVEAGGVDGEKRSSACVLRWVGEFIPKSDALPKLAAAPISIFLLCLIPPADIGSLIEVDDAIPLGVGLMFKLMEPDGVVAAFDDLSVMEEIDVVRTTGLFDRSLSWYLLK
jgi:hypothetical protein